MLLASRRCFRRAIIDTLPFDLPRRLTYQRLRHAFAVIRLSPLSRTRDRSSVPMRVVLPARACCFHDVACKRRLHHAMLNIDKIMPPCLLRAQYARLR